MSNFSLTEEQILFRWAVRDFCKKNLAPKAKEIDEKREIPNDVIKGMAQLGLLALTVPPKYGGAGADFTMATIGAEELAYADNSAATAVLYLLEAAWGYIFNKYGTKRALEEVMPKIVKGDSFLGIASTEPDAGSDVAALTTTASKDGDGYILNGEKSYISGVKEAQKLGGGYVTLAKTAPKLGHKGETLFYVPFDTPGIMPTAILENMGRMAISTGGFQMTDVHMPEEYQMGETNKAFYYTMEGFDAARVLVSASCIGASQRALEIGMDYIKEREAFGQPLAKYQGIQFDLADMVAHHEAIKTLIYKTAWMLDEKYKNGRFTALEVSKYLSMIKYLAPHHALDVFRRVMYWHGAYGYTQECPLDMGFRGVMSYCIGAEGSANIQKIVIARETLGRDWTRTR